MDFQRDESAEWSRQVSKVSGEVTDVVQKTLDDCAGRGWHQPGGPELGLILDTIKKGRLLLVEANGKLHENTRKRIHELEEFELKIAQILAKLAMELYKARIINALEIEKAEAELQTDRNKAQLVRLEADTELRTAAIIRLKAEIEHEINIYKRQLIDAEYITLEAETALVNAKLATAQEKLKIIDSIYELIAAEELVLAAEQRKAASLVKVLEAEKRVAAVKREMIPYYEDKATARLELADATKREAEVKEDIARLGFDKVALKEAEFDAEQELRDKELEMELAREQYARAATATELARAEARKQIQLRANEVRRTIDLIKAELAKEGIDLRIETQLERLKMQVDDAIELLDYEEELLRKKLASELANLILIGLDNCQTIRDGAEQVYNTATFTLHAKRVSKGTATISRPGGQGTFGDACEQPPE